MNSHAQVVRPVAVLSEPRSRGRRKRGAATEASVAAFTSPDLDKLGRALGFPVAVIAVADEVNSHARRLSETWHGCWTASAEEWVAGIMPFDFGDTTGRSTKFRHLPFDERWMGHQPLPEGMRLSGGSLRVVLAPGVSCADLGQSFGQAMAELRFDRVARRPSEVRRRHATGRALEVPARYAAEPSAGCDGRVTLVEDLYAFRPRAFPSVVGAALASLRILAMCSALAGAVAPEGRHA